MKWLNPILIYQTNKYKKVFQIFTHSILNSLIVILLPVRTETTLQDTWQLINNSINQLFTLIKKISKSVKTYWDETSKWWKQLTEAKTLANTIIRVSTMQKEVVGKLLTGL